MTERECAKKILKQNGCTGIDCSECPLDNWKNDAPSNAVEYAKQWLKENPEMTKTERIEEMERQLSALKAEVREEERVEYPCVMVSSETGRVVYFTSERSGHSIGNYAFSELSDYWEQRFFKPFTGTITYKNGKPV